jgi:hypothetical protein
MTRAEQVARARLMLAQLGQARKLALAARARGATGDVDMVLVQTRVAERQLLGMVVHPDVPEVDRVVPRARRRERRPRSRARRTARSSRAGPDDEPPDPPRGHEARRGRWSS